MLGTIDAAQLAQMSLMLILSFETLVGSIRRVNWMFDSWQLLRVKVLLSTIL